MNVKHNCVIPKPVELAQGIAYFDDKWRCPECGTRWKIVFRNMATEGVTTRQWFNIKLLRWERRAQRRLR